jgi:hypothetical protein
MPAPREEAVRRHVKEFRALIPSLMKDQHKKAEPKVDETSVARLFEEVKIMIRDLPSQLDASSKERKRDRSRGASDPSTLYQMLSSSENPMDEALAWSAVAAAVHPEMPWLEQLAREISSALIGGNHRKSVQTKKYLIRALQAARHQRPLANFTGDDRRSSNLREMPHMLMATCEGRTFQT